MNTVLKTRLILLKRYYNKILIASWQAFTSLFTNILLDETINICLNESFDKEQ